MKKTLFITATLVSLVSANPVQGIVNAATGPAGQEAVKVVTQIAVAVGVTAVVEKSATGLANDYTATAVPRLHTIAHTKNSYDFVTVSAEKANVNRGQFNDCVEEVYDAYFDSVEFMAFRTKLDASVQVCMNYSNPAGPWVKTHIGYLRFVSNNYNSVRDAADKATGSRIHKPANVNGVHWTFTSVGNPQKWDNDIVFDGKVITATALTP